MTRKKTTKKTAKKTKKSAKKPAVGPKKEIVFLEIPAKKGKAKPVTPAQLKKLKAVAGHVIKAMRKLYPDADCELRHENALQLLVATILSAQCTDKLVNRVTETLFQRYRSAEDFASADPATFEQEIRSTGFYHNKAKSIIEGCKTIVSDFGGEVPNTMDEMLTLPGVARKTANVVLGTAFRKATGVVVDTHVKRLANRIGLSKQKLPEKIERDLMEVFPEKDWIFMGHALIWHGRRVCDAKKPRCRECAIKKVCEKNEVKASV